MVYHRDRDTGAPIVLAFDAFAEQAAATLLRIRRFNLDAMEEAFALYRDGAGHSTRLRWERGVRSSSLVAVWDNDVRLPFDIRLKDGQLVAQSEDIPEYDSGEWKPIDFVVSEFVRSAVRGRRQ